MGVQAKARFPVSSPYGYWCRCICARLVQPHFIDSCARCAFNIILLHFVFISSFTLLHFLLPFHRVCCVSDNKFVIFYIFVSAITDSLFAILFLCCVVLRFFRSVVLCFHLPIYNHTFTWIYQLYATSLWLALHSVCVEWKDKFNYVLFQLTEFWPLLSRSCFFEEMFLVAKNVHSLGRLYY